MARILVADDEPSVRHMVQLAVQRAGHEVHEAIDAPSAVLAYERTKPDLLILDVNMPGGGASFVLSSLRFGGTRATCPVLVISGSLEQSPEEAKRRLQVDRVLLKPFRVHDLLSAVNEMLAKSTRGSPPPGAGGSAAAS